MDRIKDSGSFDYGSTPYGTTKYFGNELSGKIPEVESPLFHFHFLIVQTTTPQTSIIIKSQRRSMNMVPSLSAMEARIVVAKNAIA